MTVNIQHQVDLTSANTLGLSGRAAAFAHYTSLGSLIELQQSARELHLPLRVLSGGSNILLAEHINALVIKPAANTIRLIRENNSHVWVDVDAGVDWHQWVCASINYGHGLENLALIPGLVGASPVQNIGAYGVEAGDFIEQLVGYQLSTQQLRVLSGDECRFSYRNSIFKRELKNDFVIMRVRFRLQKHFTPTLNYAPLDQLNADRLTPAELINAVVDVRSSKLPDPKITPNAGSFFHNPVVTEIYAAELRQRFPAMPQYGQSVGVKLAAGWLIDQCGFKGKAFGPVSMYEKQALVLTTSKGATLSDVHNLQKIVQTKVFKTFGVWLVPEPQVFD
jgi:UDP-N-acetylmuramate dehydrogenase